MRRLRAPILHYTYADIAGHLRSVATPDGGGGRAGAARAGASASGACSASRSGASCAPACCVAACARGTPGFFVAATDAFYVFLRWARVWERERRV